MKFSPKKEQTGNVIIDKGTKCEWCQKLMKEYEYCWCYEEKNLATCKECGVLDQFKTFIGDTAIVHNVIVKTNKTKEKQEEAFQI